MHHFIGLFENKNNDGLHLFEKNLERKKSG